MSELTPRSSSLTKLENGAASVNPNDVPTMLEAYRPNSHQSPPQWLGDYELLREVARGGMGVVYQARERKLNRIVALKMILAGRLANQEDLLRFKTEAEAAAKLQHPNIVAVHDIDEVDGNHFFTMDFIQGNSLAQRVMAGPLPNKLAARYVVQIARAMQYAHEQGILHRDLKPSNVLIDVQDQVHITDFGLAKRLHGEPGQTRTGSILGTPSYMAPEQASGKTRELSPACDIYSIGAMLYELLTGRPPFKTDTPLDTIMQVLHNDPAPPRLVNPKVDHDLETICLKCLEKDARHRYISARALADDLQSYLDGNSIDARSFNILDRLTHTFGRSHLDIAFHAWSTMLFIMAGVVFVEHLAVFFLLMTGQPRWQVLLCRSSQFVLLGTVFAYHRGYRLLPTSAAERDIWSIWIGYFLAYGCTLVAVQSMSILGVIDRGARVLGSEHWQEVLPYPFISIVAGLAFFSMGSNYWGRCYAIGLGFFLIAVLMPMNLDWAPLEFGLLWTVALTVLGWHLRRLGRQAHAEAGHDSV